jgi:hypothetical protein
MLFVSVALAASSSGHALAICRPQQIDARRSIRKAKFQHTNMDSHLVTINLPVTDMNPVLLQRPSSNATTDNATGHNTQATPQVTPRSHMDSDPTENPTPFPCCPSKKTLSIWRHIHW